MAQQYTFPSYIGKHPSYYNRPVSTLQLQANATPFNNGVGNKYSTMPLPSARMANDPQYFVEDPRYIVDYTLPVYSNDANPQNKPRHINSKARESQLGGVIGHSAAPSYGNNDRQQESIDQAATARAQRAQSLIGGQNAGEDAFKTTAQIQLDGDFNLKKKSGSKRILGAQNPDEMISPITGKLVANYGDWRDNAVQKQAYEAAAASKQGETGANTSASHPLIDKVRAVLASRGANGVLGMARLFRIMDDDDSKFLSIAEFKKAMRESSLMLQDSEMTALFNLFDTDGGGTISYEEYMHILRKPLNNRRIALVKLAFNVIDTDKSGLLDISDLCDAYDVTKHPDFMSGKKSKDQILKEFLNSFIIGGLKDDGQISFEQFADYYTNIGASIDSDDYFELMIRNAWHISGGEGAAANSANRRVLVTRPDGSQYVEEIKNDLGLRSGDKEAMKFRLNAQGVNAADVSGFGSAGDNSNGFGKAPIRSNSTNTVGRMLSRPQLSNRSNSNNSSYYDKSNPGNSSHRSDGSSSNSFQSNRDETNSNEYGLVLLQALKQQLFSRDSKGLIGLERQFKIMDEDCSNSLDISEFKKVMSETNVRMKRASDAEILFQLFDRDRSGTIDFEEFLTTIRGDLNPNRKMLINMAFDKLDKYDSGYIAPEDMIGVYDTTHHPDVISRKKTSQQVLREFLDGFDVGGVIEGQITRNEFQNYYHNMSASIDDDKYFELMIRNAWHLSGGEGATANSANRRLIATRPNAQNADMKSSTFSNQGDNNASIVERLRNQALANRTNRSPAIIPPPYQDAPLTPMEIALLGPQGGDHSLPPSVPPVFTASKKMFIDSKNGLNAPGGLTDPQILPSAGVSLCIDRLKASLKSRGSSGFASLQRMFQNMDEDNNQSLSFVELKNTLKQLNMPVIESDVRKLFEHFDRDKSGTIDFGEFVDGMREPLSSSRLALVDMAFTELDIEGIDEVPFERIASQYNSGRHPEVIAKRMTPKLALANFLETFDAGVEVEGKVTRDEFINYYSNVGAAIDSDEYFDILLRSVWDLGSATNLKGEMGSPVRPSGTVRRAMIEPNSKGSGRTSTSRPGSALAVRGSIRGMGGYPGQVTTGVPLIPQQLLQQQIGLLGTSILQPMNGGIRPNAPSIGTSFPSANDAANKAKPYFSYSQGLEKPLTKGAATAAKVLGTRLNPAEKIPDNGLLHLLDRLKATLVSRGPIGFTSLQRVFQSADINGDGTLSLSEFKDALHSMQLNVIESELRQLFQFFDTDDSKSISYDEFVKGLRDDLNENRMSIVLQAFKRLDIGHNELIDIGYLACQYNGEEHPDVRSGYLTGKQALATFMDTFDAGGEIEGRVTKKEFINYYTNMGAVIENDWNFESLVRGVWGLGEGQQPMTYIYNNGPQPATNIPPSSLRTALTDKRSYPLGANLGAYDGIGNYYGNMDLNTQLQNEAQVKDVVKECQAEAVQKFSARNYSKAIEIFSEALNHLYSIYPHTHVECVKIAKSIEACQKKLSSQSNRR